MFLNWSRDMKIWAIEDNFEWTYGQVGFLLQHIYALNPSAPQLLAISQVVIILFPCWQLCYSRWREIMPLPRRLVFDIIWLISGKCQPWTNATESDLILRNLWDAFPPDVTPEEIGLPTTAPAPSLDVSPAGDTSVHTTRTRRRQNRTNLGRVTGPLEEADIADQTSNRQGPPG